MMKEWCIVFSADRKGKKFGMLPYCGQRATTSGQCQASIFTLARLRSDIVCRSARNRVPAGPVPKSGEKHLLVENYTTPSTIDGPVLEMVGSIAFATLELAWKPFKKIWA